MIVHNTEDYIYLNMTSVRDNWITTCIRAKVNMYCVNVRGTFCKLKLASQMIHILK